MCMSDGWDREKKRGGGQAERVANAKMQAIKKGKKRYTL